MCFFEVEGAGIFSFVYNILGAQKGLGGLKDALFKMYHNWQLQLLISKVIVQHINGFEPLVVAFGSSFWVPVMFQWHLLSSSILMPQSIMFPCLDQYVLT